MSDEFSAYTQYTIAYEDHLPRVFWINLVLLGTSPGGKMMRDASTNANKPESDMGNRG